MIYLTNVSTNEKLTLEICAQLDEMKIPYYRPNETIEFQGRQINVNAFDQLRKRNPNNPYIMELKRTIMELLTRNMENNNVVLIINTRSEQFIRETIFEISIAWYLKKIILSFDDITPTNGELISAMDITSLRTDLTRLTGYITTEKEIEKAKENMKKTLGGKQKLTVKE
jgi:hypothetical protein